MSTIDANASSNMPRLMPDVKMNKSSPPGIQSSSKQKPVVVGLYGIPGSGKTFLLNQLKQELGYNDFVFFEGSERIADLVPGGLEAFQKMEEEEKIQWRQRAIDSIGKICADSGKVGVVTGHLTLWPEGQTTQQPVYTQNDLETYTHILYLGISPGIICDNCRADTEKARPYRTSGDVSMWRRKEMSLLFELCRENKILLFEMTTEKVHLTKVLTLLRDFQQHSETHNLNLATSRLDEVIAMQPKLETMLVIDADKTLADVDTGSLFWTRMFGKFVTDVFNPAEQIKVTPLDELFGSPMGYSYNAFRQAVLLYEEYAADVEFETLCSSVAMAAIVQPEFKALLQMTAECDHVGAVVVTCGLRLVWEKALKSQGFSEKVKVIGGGRIADEFVVTAAVKGALIQHLREAHKLHVWAFGDSPLDLEMLRNANKAVVVVGREEARSKTMDAALTDAIDNHGLQASQALLPSNVSPRLDTGRLPIIDLTGQDFLDSIFLNRHGDNPPYVCIAAKEKENAVKLLTTPMRDATVAGPVLREAHRRVGWYLGTHYLAEQLGLEEYPVPHVLGHQSNGYRLLHENQTMIVALMRGGEPMALGISDAFPLAIFMHAGSVEDIKPHHLQGVATVMLVDSVVNTGKTITDFVHHVRKLQTSITIVVVAGVVQADFVSQNGPIHALYHDTDLSFVALRLSDTTFTGSGTTDTGNRLFNTTHLP